MKENKGIKNKGAVLIVTQSANSSNGGVENVVSNLKRYLKLNDINCLIASEENSDETDVIFKLGSPYFDIRSFFSYCTRFVALFFRFAFLCIKKDVKIINVHFISLGYNLLMLLITKVLNLKFIASCHGTDVINPQQGSRIYFLITRIVLKNADVVTACSKYLKDYLEKTYNVKNVRIFNNGIDKDFLISASDYPQEKEDIIISVGRMVEKKGYDRLIDIWSNISKKVDTKLLLVGQGEELNNLKRKVKKLRIDKNIIFYGQANRDEIKLLLKKALLFVLPSYGEPFGIVSLEAQACKLPVMAFNGGGVPETLIPNETGFLIPEGNLEYFAEKILFLLSHHDRRIEMGERGFQFVRGNFLWENQIKRYIKIINL